MAGFFSAQFPTEEVTLHKTNGDRVEKIKAIVEPDTFFIDDTSIIIEEDDFFERPLPNGAVEYYKVIERGYFEGVGRAPAHYQTKVKKVKEKEMLQSLTAEEEGKEEAKPHKVFVSHSSKDRDAVKAIVELLEEIGLPDDAIVCTSVPGHGVPGGKRIFDWLREQFTSCELRVLFVLSHNYYQSAACLNEMGAAWITKASYKLMLLPGFSYDDIKGCIDHAEPGIAFDDTEEELKHRLNELKDTLTREYNLPQIQSIRWERHRNNFIDRVRKAAEEISHETKEEESGLLYQPVDPTDNPAHIPVESAFLLVYAASDDGQIVRTSTLSSLVQITAAGKDFTPENTYRESARWEEALDRLVNWGWVKQVGRKGEIFKLTGTGYEKADWLKDQMDIDTDLDPIEQIKEFEENSDRQDSLPVFVDPIIF